MNQTYDLALKFDPDELNRTPYGAYACYYEYEVESPYGEFHVVGSEMGGGLELTMDKPDTKIYSVTVSSEGHGTAYASLGSGTTGTQVILTATPDDGWYLREWQIVSGNVRVTENRFDISHANVEIKAIFEEIATHTRTVTVMYTEGGTAHASLASGVYGTQVTLTAVPENGYAFKEWQIVCGGVTVTDNRFTIGDDDVEIRAVFILKPFYSVEIPNLITVKPKAVFTTVTVTVPELSMVPEANGKTPRQLRIAFDAGVLNNQTDPSKTLTYNLAFSMYQSSYGRQVIRSFTSAGNDTFYIRIPDSNWNAAASGVYTGTMSYRVYWFYTDNSMSGTLQSGTIPITVTIPAPGDVDCDGEVDLVDAAVLSRYLAGGWNVTVDETVADVNKDGIVNLKDVVLIRRYLAGGWDVELK